MRDVDDGSENDPADFVAFKLAWELRNGQGSLAAIAVVPEPGALAILGIGTIISMYHVRYRGQTGAWLVPQCRIGMAHRLSRVLDRQA